MHTTRIVTCDKTDTPAPPHQKQGQIVYTTPIVTCDQTHRAHHQRNQHNVKQGQIRHMRADTTTETRREARHARPRTRAPLRALQSEFTPRRAAGSVDLPYYSNEARYYCTHDNGTHEFSFLIIAISPRARAPHKAQHAGVMQPSKTFRARARARCAAPCVTGQSTRRRKKGPRCCPFCGLYTPWLSFCSRLSQRDYR
jgi:hypothetical protein